ELAQLVQSFHQAHWAQERWRGANLGGLLLLEPGPASPLFSAHGADACHDEWSLCEHLTKTLGEEGKRKAFESHRLAHFGESTLAEIASRGLNAVRVPFGYWVVTGPTLGDPFVGPALGVLDQVVERARAAGLQVLLDLHGNPGGESSERPCGRAWRGWSWRSWRQEEALEVLRQVAARYCGSECVTGLQVCNEPSEAIPIGVLCDFYLGQSAPSVPAAWAQSAWPWCSRCSRISAAPRPCLEVPQGEFPAVRQRGLRRALLPHLQPHPLLPSHRQHLDICEDHGLEVASMPAALVGEWSLARPGRFAEEEIAAFAAAQVRAYDTASHGWFFWNWHDHEHLLGGTKGCLALAPPRQEGGDGGGGEGGGGGGGRRQGGRQPR
ncbi:unnamed protein product, partial [Prorocentrum cordatum]